MTAACTGRWISAPPSARRCMPRADGTVETAYHWNGRRTQGDTNSYGNMVKLRHADYRGGRLETLYAHLSKLCVAQGETVYEGQLIGYSGDTGNC